MAQDMKSADMEANLVAYIKEKDARIAKLEKDLEEAQERRKKSGAVYDKMHPTPAESPKVEEKKEEPAPAPHFVGKWQKFCPTCGEANPEFKDETVCKDCGMHLGAVDDLPKIKACPNCGGKEAKKLEIKAD